MTAVVLAVGFTGVCYFLDRITDAVEQIAKTNRRQAQKGQPE